MTTRVLQRLQKAKANEDVKTLSVFGHRGALKANKIRREKRVQKEIEERQRKEQEDALNAKRIKRLVADSIARQREAHEDICPVDD